jgi:hypothetical protein
VVVVDHDERAGILTPVGDQRRDRLSLDERIEVERDRRRRMVAAILYGAEARPATMPPRAWGPAVAGVALGLFIALAVGLGTLVRLALPH